MDLRTILHTAINEGLSKYANTLLRYEDHRRPEQGRHVREDEYSGNNERHGHSQWPANIQYPGSAEERRPQEDVTHVAPNQKRRRSNSFVDHTQAEKELGPAAPKKRKTTKTIMEPHEHGHEPRGTFIGSNVSLSDGVGWDESSHDDRTKRWLSTLPADARYPLPPMFATTFEGTDTPKVMPNVTQDPISEQRRNPGPSKDCRVCQNWIKYYQEVSGHTDLQRRYEDTSRIPRLFARYGVDCDCDYDRDEWRLRQRAQDGESFSCGYGLRNMEPYFVLHLAILQMCDELPGSVYEQKQTDPYLYLEMMERGVCDVCKGWQKYHAEIRELAKEIMAQNPRKHIAELRYTIQSEKREQDHERLPRLFEVSGLECSCTEQTKMRTLEASLSAGVPSANVNFDSYKDCKFGTRYRSPEAFITPRDSKTGICGYCKRWERYWKNTDSIDDDQRRAEDVQRVPLYFDANGPLDCTCTAEGEKHKLDTHNYGYTRVGPLDDSPRSFLRKYGDFYPPTGQYRSRMASEKAPWEDRESVYDRSVTSWADMSDGQFEFFLEDKILRPYQRQFVLRVLSDGDQKSSPNFQVFNTIKKVVVRYKQDMEHLDSLLKSVASRLKEPIPELDEALEVIRKVIQGDHDGKPSPDGEEDVPVVRVVDNKDADTRPRSERADEQI